MNITCFGTVCRINGMGTNLRIHLAIDVVIVFFLKANLSFALFLAVLWATTERFYSAMKTPTSHSVGK